jgi:hypothetical protein
MTGALNNTVFVELSLRCGMTPFCAKTETVRSLIWKTSASCFADKNVVFTGNFIGLGRRFLNRCWLDFWNLLLFSFAFFGQGPTGVGILETNLR